MKHYDVAHGSDAWGILRIGRPTSSDFDNLITPKGTPCKGEKVEKYENKLIAEIMLRQPIRTIDPTFWMERGTLLEGRARETYQFIHDVDIVHGGFITDDHGHAGCSPDGQIPATNGGLEIKCPAPHTHVNYLLNRDDATFIEQYKPQYQGQILVAGFSYVDMFSYHPDLPPVTIRMEPDPVFLATLAEALQKSRESMNRKIERLVNDGHLEIEGYQKLIDDVQAKTGRYDKFKIIA